MAKLTKKYIFEQKLNGKPIIIFVEVGHGRRWATKEDIDMLRECGILVKHNSKNEWSYNLQEVITTHEILTYLEPFDLDNEPVTRLPKGRHLPLFLDDDATD